MEGAPRVNVGGRAWFDDADRPGRRLAVHARPERGWTTVSVWDGEECRATFHLRQSDAAQLIYDLAAGLGDGTGASGSWADVAPAGGPRAPAPPWRAPLDTAANLLGRGSRWLHDLAGSEPSETPPTPPPRLRVVEDPDNCSG